MRIELLTSPGCPNAADARAAVAECLTALGIDVPIIESVGRYPSPTVLVDGIDIMRPDGATLEGDACRLDPPTAQRIRDALRKGAEMIAGLMPTALRLLARGAPVTMTELAAAAGVDVADVDNAPGASDIEYDDEHRIVGWGLTLVPTPHQFIVDGRRLYTWCAADTLMFPAIIGRPAQIESHCDTTDAEIRFAVDPDEGVSGLSPATAVISIPPSDELDVSRVRTSCCDPGRFFATAEAAADWRARHPSGSVLPVADAYPRVQPILSRLLG